MPNRSEERGRLGSEHWEEGWLSRALRARMPRACSWGQNLPSDPSEAPGTPQDPSFSVVPRLPGVCSRLSDQFLPLQPRVWTLGPALAGTVGGGGERRRGREGSPRPLGLRERVTA